jgi:Ca2+-binding RTX toxin-like protein
MIQTHDVTAQDQPSGDSPFLATETAAGDQFEPIVVALAGGGFALIWSLFVGGTNMKAVVRYFDADGTPATGEIILFSDEFVRDLSATPTADGGFLLTRTALDEPAGTGTNSVRAQAYDSSGAKVGPEMIAGANSGYPSQPAAVQLASGGYAIGWLVNESEVHVQRFTSAGAPLGSQIVAGTGTAATEPLGLVATSDGGFALAWVQPGATSNDPPQVKARFFDSSGAAYGPPLAVAGAGLTIETPTLVALAGGGYVLGWAEYSGSAGGSTFQLKALPIGADGKASGPPATLATYSSESQFGPEPAFATHPDGGFVAMWPEAGTDRNGHLIYGFTARQFDSSGAPIGPEFQPTPAGEGGGDIAVLADGTIATAWTGRDSDGRGVFARVYPPADGQGPTSGDDVIHGGSGADIIDGLGGNDELYGHGGDDELLGRAGNDRLNGGTGNDVLRGGGGNDILNGGSGRDEMRGGAGDDVYFVDDALDWVVEGVGAGIDEIRTARAAFSLAAIPDVENLTATSDIAHDFRGSAGNNVVTGGGGADLLYMYDGGDDTVIAGAGNDNIYFIGALTAADVVNGGSGVDTLVVQGPYGSLTLTANITQIENFSILGGNNTHFGEPGTNRYDYVLTTNDANFAAGVQARINGSALLAGEDFTFNGSAETDASFVVYGGRGKDTLTGGLGNDIFFFAEERFASGDTVNGGAGYDGMFLRGNYTIDFNAPGYTGLFTNIENLTLTSATDERYARGGGTEFDYNLTLSNALVGAGQQLTISGALLQSNETMVVNASAETNGTLRVFGGKASDTLKGGALNDLLHGNLGADTLAGGGGADTFQYGSIAESTSGSRDHILDFAAGSDRVDLSRIDADSLTAGNQAFTWIGSSAFSGSAGQLRAFQQSGTWFVEGDTNGDGTADLVIALTLQGPTPLGAGDFLL